MKCQAIICEWWKLFTVIGDINKCDNWNELLLNLDENLIFAMYIFYAINESYVGAPYEEINNLYKRQNDWEKK